MSLTFREDYWDDVEAKRTFIEFIRRIHNLDLTYWDEMGYWDSRYRPFSFFDGKTLVSNVCIYSMEMSVAGRRCRAAQVSGVATIPEMRRKGLCLELTRIAMDRFRPDHDFFFLFADNDAFPFYETCGFHRAAESRPHIAISGRAPAAGAVKLDTGRKDHVERIHRFALERGPVSSELGTLNDRLFMLWCLYALKDDIHAIDDLDLLVLSRREGGVLTIFDIVGKRIPPFLEIYPFIAGESDRRVEFQFLPDRLDLTEHLEWTREEKNGAHHFGDFPLEGKRFIFPFTSHA